MTAAAARKMQKEIENVLKKVDDGIGEFGEYWEQATATASSQQKEKLGEELKRSINKLQRLRAQIREWISQNGVQSNSKDKLEDARRRIEHDMQRFKDFERELKIKAFSTCALARADELEIEELEKMKYQEWLTETIQRLNDQLDQFEADMELLGNKKSLSNDDKSNLLQLKLHQERHRWHIKKLELVLRAVDNDVIDISDLAVVRESIELYVENHQDPDCYHDEGLYECFDLTEFEDRALKPPKSPSEVQKDTSPQVSSGEEPQKKATKDKEKRRKEDKKGKKKEERDKKAVGTPQNASGGGNSTKAGGGSNKAGAQSSPETDNSKSEVRENIEPEEVKVQEDQLLSEADEFICKICQIHVVGCSPKLTSCSHLFCGDCIAQWFSQHPESQTWAQRARAAGPERVVPCPVCKQPLNENRDLYPLCGVTCRSENLLLWRMLSSLKIMCANHPKVLPDGRCDWTGEYGSYQKHISVCKNQPPGQGGVALNTDTSMPLASATADSAQSYATVSKDASRKNTPALTPQSTPVASTDPSPKFPATPTAGLPESPSVWSNTSSAIQTKPQSTKPTAKPSLDSTPASAATTPAASAPATAPKVAAPAAAPAAPTSPAHATSPAPSTSAPVSVDAAPSTRPGATAQTAVPTPGAQAGAARSPAHAGSSRSPAANHETEPGAAQGAGVVATSALSASAVAQESKTPASTAATPTAQSQDNAGPLSPAEQSESDGSYVEQAMSSFDPTGTNMIPVKTGDLIRVLEEHKTGWTYAKNLSLKNGNNTGWVPSWIVPARGSTTPAGGDVASQTKTKLTGEAQQSQQKESSRPQPQAVQPQSAPASQSAATTQPAQQVQQVAAAPAMSASAMDGRTVMRANDAFVGTSPSQLTLAPADLIEIVERHTSGWTYGRKLSDGGAVIEGWFPDWVVCPQK